MKASGAALLLKVLNTGLGLATTIVLARALGPDSYGVYAFALAVVMVVGLPAKAGVPQLVTRETAKGQAAEDWAAVKGVWRWSNTIVLTTSFIVLALALAVMVGFSFLRHVASETVITLAISLLLIPLMALALVRASSLRGLGKTVQGQLPELVIKPLALLMLLGVGVLLGPLGKITAPLAMTLNIAATALAFMLGAIMLRRVTPREIRQAPLAYQSRTWLAAIVPMAAINGMHLIITQADVLMIGVFMENADVGHYKVAAQASLIVSFGLQTTKMVAEPYYSRFYHQGDLAKLQKLAQGASRLNLSIAIVVFVLLTVFGTDLLKVAFGAAFAAAFVPMLILSTGRLASSVVGSSGHLLNMAGYQKEYARFWIAAAIINVILNLILIPLFGTTGAAIATASTLLFANGLGWAAAKRWIGCDCSPLPLSR